MQRAETRSAFAQSRTTSQAKLFASLLQSFYQGLLDRGVPEHMANLVRQLEGTRARPGGEGRRLALVVESDDESRALAAALLEETDLAVVECASAEAALAVLQHRGSEVAFVFADQHLAGPRDGLDFARTVATLWPQVRTVVTADTSGGQPPDLPPTVVALGKPWGGLDVLIEAERALLVGPRS